VPLTLQQAADRSGSCPAYVSAVLLMREAVRYGWANESWVNQVRRGELGVLQAARLMKPVVELLKAFAQATPMAKRVLFQVTGLTNDLTTLMVNSPPAERTKSAWGVGLEVVWSQMIEPLTRDVKAAE
jgi:hypothetical protein